MQAFVIRLENNEYSERVAERCIASGKKYGIKVEPFNAITKEEAYSELKKLKLEWGWANNNTKNTICPYTGLLQFPYTCKDLRTKIACSLSHFHLWCLSVFLWEPILILEHDAVFIRELPEIDFKGICQINDPAGCTPKGKAWSRNMHKRGRNLSADAWPKTRIEYKDNRPDGLAGNSAYLIHHHAALQLVNAFKEYGVWPNDATICIQLFPYLEEYYPFIIETRQEKSTTV